MCIQLSNIMQKTQDKKANSVVTFTRIISYLSSFLMFQGPIFCFLFMELLLESICVWQILCLAKNFFGFILIGICSFFWLCKCMSLAKFGGYLAIIFFDYFLSSPSWNPMTYYFLKSHTSLGLFILSPVSLCHLHLAIYMILFPVHRFFSLYILFCSWAFLYPLYFSTLKLLIYIFWYFAEGF